MWSKNDASPWQDISQEMLVQKIDATGLVQKILGPKESSSFGAWFHFTI
jgi:hypothetical protein